MLLVESNGIKWGEQCLWLKKKDWLTVSIGSVCRNPGSDAGRGLSSSVAASLLLSFRCHCPAVLRLPGINQGFHVPLQGGEWECADPQGPHSHRHTPLGGPLWRKADHWDWWVWTRPFQKACPITSNQWLYLEPDTRAMDIYLREDESWPLFFPVHTHKIFQSSCPLNAKVKTNSVKKKSVQNRHCSRQSL